MAHLNIEIKAKCDDPGLIREYLKKNHADCKGTDHQRDTYFNVPNGRLKLREGNIENNLIYYQRADKRGARESNFHLVPVPDATELKLLLTQSLGVKMVVDKRREIWFIKNVKFHIDSVSGLGNFVEIEASDLHANVSKEDLQKQCDFYVAEFNLRDDDMVAVSYSDMLQGQPEQMGSGQTGREE